MNDVKFEGLVNLSTEENEVLKEYIDRKINAALEEIRNEIKALKTASVKKEEAVTQADIGKLVNMARLGR